jgi:hypothetical protein
MLSAQDAAACLHRHPSHAPSTFLPGSADDRISAYSQGGAQTARRFRPGPLFRPTVVLVRHLDAHNGLRATTAHPPDSTFFGEVARRVGRTPLLLGQLQDSQFQGPDHRLGAIGDSQLSDNVLDVVLGGAQAYHQLSGDLAVGVP